VSEGLLLVVLAPSGGGKGTILNEVMHKNEKMCFSVSATTRNPRPGETDGKEYFFVSHEEFEQMIRNEQVLEYAEYCGNYYGTPKEQVQKWTKEGYDVVLEIEVQGALQVKKLMPKAVCMFILPPSLEVLEDRLRRRGTETDEIIKNRMETAIKEIKASAFCDYLIINDRLEDAVEDMKAIIKTEKMKMKRNRKFIEEVLKNA